MEQQENFSKCIKMKELLIKFTIRIGVYKPLVRFKNYVENKVLWIKFRRYGTKTLIQFDKLCREIGVKVFPLFGTQLGLFRDKNFIPFDNDIDFGVIADERPDNFVQLLEQGGFHLREYFYFKEDGRIVLEHYSSTKGVHVDIFNLYELSESDYFCYVARNHETKRGKDANATDGLPCIIWPLEKCGLVEKEFFGHEFYMPEKSKEWLQGIYGDDFMTPVKNWTVGKRKTRIIHPKERIYKKYVN